MWMLCIYHSFSSSKKNLNKLHLVVFRQKLGVQKRKSESSDYHLGACCDIFYFKVLATRKKEMMHLRYGYTNGMKAQSPLRIKKEI